MTLDFKGPKRPPDYYWLPTGTGECYHAKRCGAHDLEAVEDDVAIPIIRENGLEPCGNCVQHHGLDPIDGDGRGT